MSHPVTRTVQLSAAEGTCSTPMHAYRIRSYSVADDRHAYAACQCCMAGPWRPWKGLAGAECKQGAPSFVKSCLLRQPRTLRGAPRGGVCIESTPRTANFTKWEKSNSVVPETNTALQAGKPATQRTSANSVRRIAHSLAMLMLRSGKLARDVWALLLWVEAPTGLMDVVRVERKGRDMWALRVESYKALATSRDLPLPCRRPDVMT
jgi:hypothetical protein